MRWDGWGDPERAGPLPPGVATLVEQVFGPRHERPRPVTLAELRLPPPTLEAADLRALAAAGQCQVSTAIADRVRHARGRSTPDLIRLRAGTVTTAPDAVVLPASHDRVAALLAACSERRIGVVPYGGGTSVVGGLEPSRAGLRGMVALDLALMNRMLDLDQVSRTAVFEPGVRGAEAERMLAAHGHTLGHFPQSFEWASLGGFAATRSAGQASAGYGRFEDIVIALRAATPAGELRTAAVPASAAGPDLRRLLLGSEGTLGVITELTLSVAMAPESRIYEGWRFASFDAGSEAVRGLLQDGPRPAVVRLSDETETAVNLADPADVGSTAGGCLLIAGYEGTADKVARRRDDAARILAKYAGIPLGTEPGQAWVKGRYAAPYLRDALLDAGVFVETVETAALWTALPRLYQAVRYALTRALTDAGTPPVVMCHISHAYPVGASLYFTIVCALEPQWPEGWQAAKQAAGQAILDAGGTITHHHGIGAEHRQHYASEIGPVGAAVLRGVKAVLDPQGICNPGILLACEPLSGAPASDEA